MGLQLVNCEWTVGMCWVLTCCAPGVLCMCSWCCVVMLWVYFCVWNGWAMGALQVRCGCAVGELWVCKSCTLVML